MPSLTVHCLVKNEDRFIWYAIKSVVDFVDQVLVFDTGSTDETVEIIKELRSLYPNKILFEAKGECDKRRHTLLRQEMIERTNTSWFMILDGDEVWTRRAIREALETMRTRTNLECLIAPFYLCVGDIYHKSRYGQYVLNGKKAHATPRFFKKTTGIHWDGEYNNDAVIDGSGVKVFEKEHVAWLTDHFWHLTHLIRSSGSGEEFSSGSVRKDKRRLTYFLVGKKINEEIPEVFLIKPQPKYIQRLSFLRSFINLLKLLAFKFLTSIS